MAEEAAASSLPSSEEARPSLDEGLVKVTFDQRRRREEQEQEEQEAGKKRNTYK